MNETGQLALIKEISLYYPEIPFQDDIFDRWTGSIQTPQLLVYFDQGIDQLEEGLVGFLNDPVSNGIMILHR